MKSYLVGGAVRDQLLGLEIKDRDWVVVGADVQSMLDKGYVQVGADFPVFLHPESKEEYALARTEEKTGAGYHGFDSRFDPDVTLEEDLSRRDLTINAMAMSEEGELCDPYGGREDLENRVMRHVTDAFAEDPLRVLRVARFMARFKGMGFTVAPETLDLMKQLVESGELAHLTPERVWKELSRALLEPSPEAFIEVLREVGALTVLLPEVDALFGVPQPELHHPEIDTGVHTLMALVQVTKLSNDLAVRFAVLVHDLGKGLTPKDEWPKHIQHEERGVEPVNVLCDRLKVPNAVRKLAVSVTRFHLNAHRALELKPSSVMKLIERTDALRNPTGFEQFVLACQADAQGRLGLEDKPYPQADRLRAALNAAKGISAKELVDAGYKGEKLGIMLRQKRIEAIKALS